MKYGYCRVSTDEQTTNLQVDALQAVGCDRIFSDEGISGTVRVRPGLTELLDVVEPGDEVVVWRLDRLGRSLPHLIELVTHFGAVGVEFMSLSEHLDTSTAGGSLIFNIMASLAQFERDLTVERTRAGIDAAKRRGTHCGRPRKLGRDQLTVARRTHDGRPISTTSR